MGLFPSNFAEVLEIENTDGGEGQTVEKLETESSVGGGSQTKVVEKISMAKTRESSGCR